MHKWLDFLVAGHKNSDLFGCFQFVQIDLWADIRAIHKSDGKPIDWKHDQHNYKGPSF